MSIPLLATKLHVPRPRANRVSRSRLIERLDDGLRAGHKLTLVSAPAGFGKTTLISAWAASGDRPVAWLSLDEADGDLARFLAYLAAALQKVGLAIEADAVADANASVATETFLTELVNQIAAAPEPFILVLDDYHLVTAQPVHDAVTFLLDHAPEAVHLAIATRADPPLPVARLRARGRLTELRMADLRFTPEEAADFLERAMGLALPADDVAALASRTEGWIAGLQMAALSMEGKKDVRSFVQAFAGSNRYILDYLLEEVLRREPEHVQAFLLQTSILDRLCGPLCDAVIGNRQGLDSQALLEHLEASNLFIVPLDDERCWYRYHRLFADLLRQRLGQGSPPSALSVNGGEVVVLHRRASEWFEQNGLAGEAIDHALKGKTLERAADLVERHAEETLMRSEGVTFLRWVDALPDELVCARPLLCTFHAWMLLLHGQPLRVIEARLREVEKAGERVAGQVTALRGLMAAFRGQVSRAIELCRRALEQLPENERFARTFATWILGASRLVGGEGESDGQTFDDALKMSRRVGNVMLSVMILCNRGEILMRQGRLHEAAVAYRQALELGTDARGHRLPIAGQALIGLGDLAREWNDLDAAARYLTEGIELSEQWTEVGPFDAYIALTRLRLARGEFDGAWEVLERARELAARFDLTELDDLSVAMIRAWLWVAQGNLEPAQRWAEERGLTQYIDSPLKEEADAPYDHRMHKYELLVLARLLLAQERSTEALRVLDPLTPIAEWRGRPGLLIEIHVLQALAHHARGDLDRALEALQRALFLGEPEGHMRILLDEAGSAEGAPLAALLREAIRRDISVAYAGRLLAALGAEVQDAAPVPPPVSNLIEPLSAREMDVLRLLNTHLSSTEIAEQLCISVNTARFHIKNIYGKLDVHSRSDAVERAGELGLV